MAWLLNLTPGKIAQAAPATLTEYGHLLETFAVGEILKQVSWSDAPVATGHFRTEAGDEVDLVLERDDGQVIAFEIKAGSRVGGQDLRGLRQLKARLGARLEEGILLYTGCMPTCTTTGSRSCRWIGSGQPASRDGATGSQGCSGCEGCAGRMIQSAEPSAAPEAASPGRWAFRRRAGRYARVGG